MNLDIESIFSHHLPKSEDVAEYHERVREAVKAVAYEFLAIIPESPERTLAIRHLQQAMMFANSAIAQYS